MTILKGWIYYQKLDLDSSDNSEAKIDEFLGETGWKVKNYTFLDPQTRMPIKLIKSILKSYYDRWFQNNFVIMDEYLERLEGDIAKAIPTENF